MVTSMDAAVQVLSATIGSMSSENDVGRKSLTTDGAKPSINRNQLA